MYDSMNGRAEQSAHNTQEHENDTHFKTDLPPFTLVCGDLLFHHHRRAVFRFTVCRTPVLLRGTVYSRPCLAVVRGYRFRSDNHSFNLLKYTNMETKTFIKNGTTETKLFGEETYKQCCLGAFLFRLQIPPYQRAGVHNPTQDVDTMPCRT